MNNLNVSIIIISISISVFIFSALYLLLKHSGNLKPYILNFYQNGRIFKSHRENNNTSNGFFDVPGFKENKGFGKNIFNLNLKLLLESRGFINIFIFKIKTYEEFFTLRIILSLSGFAAILVSGFFVSKNLLLYAVIIALVFYLLPVEIVKGKIKAIAKKVLNELPDTIDIMASLIKAGLTTDETLVYIFKNHSGEIAILFRAYNIKILEGISRKEAFDSIGKMSFCTEFISFVKVIHQSEIIGNPIKEVLKDLSRVYRNNQRDSLKMRAEKLESNLILVIFIFIFIPMLMIFMIPIIPQLKVIVG